LTLVLCASALIVTGGIKTALGGGGYGSLVLLINDNSGLYEGSIISCVAIAIIPLIVWLAQHGTIFKPDWKVKTYAAALTFAALLIPVGTQARTGLVCIAVLALLFIRQTKRRFLYLTGAALVGLAAIPFLPSAFSQRMETIQDYKADESAATRVAVWKWTWEFVKEHPFGGGFDAYRINKIRYDLPVVDENGFDTGAIDRKEIVDQGRAYHSSYFEMLGEQGFPGLIIWLLIHVGGVWRMEMVARMYKRRNRRGKLGRPACHRDCKMRRSSIWSDRCLSASPFSPSSICWLRCSWGSIPIWRAGASEAAGRPSARNGMNAKEISPAS
jgi:putative inorganic carbon (HCO3(-)) transporter